jgi:uncharacterized protein (DUF58 family)
VVAGLLAFMIATGYAGMINIKGIIPELVPPDELFSGSPGSFRVLLYNKKNRIPSFLLKLSSPGNKETLVPFVGGGKSLETTINLAFHQRGKNTIGQIRISSPFPVNFFTRYWSFYLDTVCVVYPRLIPIALQDSTDGSERFGAMVRRNRGHDGELEGIREYSGTEPLRSIHWKLSARTEELLVKEFGSQSAPPLIIRPDMLPGIDSEEKLSHAAWLVKQQVMDQPVGMEIDGRIILPDTGRRQCRLLLTELALYGHD